MTLAAPTLMPDTLRRRMTAARFHLVLDADHYWFRADGEAYSAALAFLAAHEGAVLTLLTRQLPWDACKALSAHPFPLACHLIAAEGETLLHLPRGGEWLPDQDFEAWAWRLTSPSIQRDLPRQHTVSLAIQFLECFWNAPRPLIVCLGDPDLAPALGLADTACIPRAWEAPLDGPEDLVRVTAPSLVEIFDVIRRRLPGEGAQDAPASAAPELTPRIPGELRGPEGPGGRRRSAAPGYFTHPMATASRPA